MGIAHVPDELPARVAEVRLAVEVVVAQRLDADPVDGAYEVAVGDRVARAARCATGTPRARVTWRSG